MARILVADDHDALRRGLALSLTTAGHDVDEAANGNAALDRKSTRLNSSHLVISYAVFCLKKKRTACTNDMAKMSVQSEDYPQWTHSEYMSAVQPAYMSDRRPRHPYSPIDGHIHHVSACL